MIRRIVGTAVLVGVGVAAVAAVAYGPRILRAARPVLREGLKRGMEIYVQARGAVAEAAEDMEDLVAEVRAEVSAATGMSEKQDA